MKHEIEKLLDRLASKELTFGQYVEIEQKRYGVPNEWYQYKVVGPLNSNTYTDCPVVSGECEAKIHGEVVPVVQAICCGVSEELVERFKIADVKFYGHPIRIGDVLDKIRWRAAPKFWKEAEPLIEIWGDVKVGFTKSLQEIFAEAEWEEVECFRATYASGHEEVRMCLAPKQPAIRELFSFLLTLGL